MVADRTPISFVVPLLLSFVLQLTVAAEAVEKPVPDSGQTTGTAGKRSTVRSTEQASSTSRSGGGHSHTNSDSNQSGTGSITGRSTGHSGTGHSGIGHSGTGHSGATASARGHLGASHSSLGHTGTTGSNTSRSGASHSHVSASTASRSEAKSSPRFVSVLVRDRHGRLKRVLREESISGKSTSLTAGGGAGDRQKGGASRFHIEKRRVVIVTRDRHGRAHRTTRIEEVRVADQKEAKGSASQKADGKGKDNDDEPKEAVHVSPNFSKTYALYDQGVNARLSREYQAAISDLGRALDMVPENDHGGIPVLQLNMEYDLALAAEGKGDFDLAARYYARAVADRPNFTEASVRLATVLAKNGNYVDALKAARAGVEHSPGDPRTHAILAVIMAKMGLSAQASLERQKTATLLANPSNIHLPPEPAASQVSPNQTTQPTVPGSGGTPSHDETQEMIPTEAPMSQPQGGDTDQLGAPGTNPSPSSSPPSSPSSVKSPNGASEIDSRKGVNKSGEQQSLPSNQMLHSAPTPGQTSSQR